MAKTEGAAAPPAIPVIDTEAFRRKLAGLADPLAERGSDASRRVHMREAAARLCAILAELYEVDKDRLQIRDHVAKALEVADHATTGDDVDRFVNECLVAVKADMGRASAHDGLVGLLMEAEGWDDPTRSDFLAYLRTHRVSALVHGFRKWGDIKAEKNAARGRDAAKGGGE